MLRVGGIGVNRHRCRAQLIDTLLNATRNFRSIARAFVAQTLRAHAANSKTDQEIRQRAAFGKADQAAWILHPRHRIGYRVAHASAFFGNQGMSTLVLGWLARYALPGDRKDWASVFGPPLPHINETN